VSSNIKISYDDEAGALYASAPCSADARPMRTRKVSSVIYVNLHRVTGEPLGLELLDVPHTVAGWLDAPERDKIPAEFFGAVAEWLGARPLRSRGVAYVSPAARRGLRFGPLRAALGRSLVQSLSAGADGRGWR
jgi:hypothetical protein